MSYILASIAAALALTASCGPQGQGGSDEPEKPIRLEAPGGVALTEATDASLSFSWNAVADAKNYGYRLLKGMTEVRRGSTTGTSATIDGLDEKTTYRFSVRSERGSVSSDYCGHVEATTGAKPAPPVVEPDPIADLYKSMMMPQAEESDGLVRAFPGAEGGGMWTTGGRGGKVLHVTSLSDDGSKGTLRWAVNEKGARTIVFDVAGIIELGSPLVIKNGNLTIAGQTAPGDGICIKGRYTNISADNVIIRFVRFRLGDTSSGLTDSDDAIWGRYCSNIILDHCSMSWSVDECASFYANSNFTMQWCMIAESMRSCIHSKGSHGYGGIWGGENASFHHNVLAHHDSRNPRFDHPHIYENHKTVPHRGVVDFRNNVVYDWGSNSSYGGEGYGAGLGTGINMVGNTYKPGPSSNDKKYFLDAYGSYTSSCSSCGTKPTDGYPDGYPLVYMSGNVHTRYADISADNASGIYWHNKDGFANYGKTSASEFAVKGPAGQTCYNTTHIAGKALETTVANAGASLRRDKVDARTASDVSGGKGKIIDCVSATAGKVSVDELYGFTWPSYKASEEQLKQTLDSDGDGIPDHYEALFGLDRNNAADGAARTIDSKGRYTNLEMYLHYLVREVMAAGNEGGEYKSINQ